LQTSVVVKSMDHCPICDVAVRPENLLRHLNDIHPRHPDTPKLVERLKAEPGRIAARAPSRPLRVSRWQVLIVLIQLRCEHQHGVVESKLRPRRRVLPQAVQGLRHPVLRRLGKGG